MIADTRIARDKVIVAHDSELSFDARNRSIRQLDYTFNLDTSLQFPRGAPRENSVFY